MKSFVIILLVGSIVLASICGMVVYSKIDAVMKEGRTTTSTTEYVPSTTEYVAPKIWEKAYYVDVFQQPTNEWYIRPVKLFQGTFSNVAITNEPLTVNVLIDKNGITFVLYEYGSQQVKNTHSSPSYYDIKMKTPDGQIYDVAGEMYAKDGDRIHILDDDRSLVLAALTGKGIVSFYVENRDRPSTNYLFNIETGNAVELFYEEVY